jgi:UDP-2,3-diacylglucosamine hydrolase
LILGNNKSVYFASDLHLGLYPKDNSLKREKLFVKWLDSIRPDIQELYLLGDVFDFWWEYNRVVPKGFVRLLGKLAEFTDAGIPVHFFCGNHDMWIHKYFEQEIGMTIYKRSVLRTIYGKTFLIGHGDDLGRGDFGYKLLNKLFKNRVLRWMYSRIHPNLGVAIGQGWAKRSRYSKPFSEEFKGEEKERLVQYANEKLRSESIDYFVFGHRHIPVKLQLTDSSVFVNLGDWITHFTYGKFNGNTFELNRFSSNA